MFMSKIIADGENLTTAEIWQRLKKLESGWVIAKHISNSNGNNAGVNQLHGKKLFWGGKKQKCSNHQGNQTGKQPTNLQQQKQQQQWQPQCQGCKPPFKLWHQGQDQHVQKGQHQQKPNHYQKKPIIDYSICMKCGDTQHRTGFTCPASRYQCKKCKKFGHFIKSCLIYDGQCQWTQPGPNWWGCPLTENKCIQCLQGDLLHMKCKGPKAKKHIYANLKSNGTNNYVWTRVHTAADVILLPGTMYTQIYEDSNLEHLGPMDTSLSVYNDSAVQAFRTCAIPLVSPIDGCIHGTKFYVANHSDSVLFSCEDLLYQKLIQPHPVLSKLAPHSAHIISREHDTAYINFVTRDKNTSHYCVAHPRTPSKTRVHDNSVPHNLEQIKQKYAEIFKGLGTFLGDPYQITLYPTVLPVWVPCRPVPIHQQEELKCQLNNMEKAGVIVPVHQATAWISSYGIVESENKKKKMHICLDPTPLIKAMLREPFSCHTPDDVYNKLAEATCSTVIHLKKGCWQVPLDNESSHLTTFNTPFGCYWFTRFPFGITMSGDTFQRQLDAIYGNLPHTIGIAHDMIIWGKTRFLRPW